MQNILNTIIRCDGFQVFNGCTVLQNSYRIFHENLRKQVLIVQQLCAGCHKYVCMQVQVAFLQNVHLLMQVSVRLARTYGIYVLSRSGSGRNLLSVARAGCYHSRDMKILNILFSRVRIKPTSYHPYSRTLVPLRHDWRHTNILC